MSPSAVRGDILLAAEQLILGSGIRAATTRAIAKAAGCSEGSIYRHFPGKNALVVEVVNACQPDFVRVLDELLGKAGHGSVQRNLREVSGKALGFYRAILPVTSGLLSDPGLLEEHRMSFNAAKTGPVRAVADVEAYLEKEQALGRISADVSAGDCARMLLGTLFAQALLERLTGELGPRRQPDDQLVDGVLGTLWIALRPQDGLLASTG
jgi:AcrR family transcriptional regulator